MPADDRAGCSTRCSRCCRPRARRAHRRGHAAARRRPRRPRRAVHADPPRLADRPPAREVGTTDRAIVVHADTIGCMVRELKDNGRLEIVPVGTFTRPLRRGRPGRDLHRRPDDVHHRHGPAAQGQRARVRRRGRHPADGWDHVEVRVDEHVSDPRGPGGARASRSATSSRSSPAPISPTTGSSSRATSTARPASPPRWRWRRTSCRGQVVLPHRTTIMVTITEEVGHGASHGLPPDVAEMVSIDNAVCAPGQHSIEDGVTIPMADLHGPVRLPPHPPPVPAREEHGHPLRPRHLPLLPLRRRRRARGGRRDPGRARRLRGRRQPRLGAHATWTRWRRATSCHAGCGRR